MNYASAYSCSFLIVVIDSNSEITALIACFMVRALTVTLVACIARAAIVVLKMLQHASTSPSTHGPIREIFSLVVRKDSYVCCAEAVTDWPDQKLIIILAANTWKSRRYTVEGMSE